MLRRALLTGTSPAALLRALPPGYFARHQFKVAEAGEVIVTARS